MSIAIFLEQPFDPNAGGVERSTSKLSLIFKTYGYNVIIISTSNTINKLDVWNDIPIFYINIDKDYFLFRKLVEQKRISLIINQAGYSYRLTKFLSINLTDGIKVINTLRINPLNFYDHHKFFISNFLKNKGLSFFRNKLTFKLILLYHIAKQRYQLNYIIKNTNAFVMLSERFKEELYFLAPGLIQFDYKIFGIGNPFERPIIDLSSMNKENVILFVGRLNILQKRVDLLLDIWRKLHASSPDWKFWVVGEGESQSYMENFCKINQLNRVTFFGKDNPSEYYKKAKIFHMTSAFEGFGNVLVEAQSYGCVPILFNSYSAANDIIKHDDNGVLVSPFSIGEYINQTNRLIADPGKLSEMALNGYENVKRFSYDETFSKWDHVFKKINKMLTND
jgi:glycosyltransferase involved in cell wall biosynthesis